MDIECSVARELVRLAKTLTSEVEFLKNWDLKNGRWETVIGGVEDKDRLRKVIADALGADPLQVEVRRHGRSPNAAWQVSVAEYVFPPMREHDKYRAFMREVRTKLAGSRKAAPPSIADTALGKRIMVLTKRLPIPGEVNSAWMAALASELKMQLRNQPRTKMFDEALVRTLNDVQGIERALDDAYVIENIMQMSPAGTLDPGELEEVIDEMRDDIKSGDMTYGADEVIRLLLLSTLPEHLAEVELASPTMPKAGFPVALKKKKVDKIRGRMTEDGYIDGETIITFTYATPVSSKLLASLKRQMAVLSQRHLGSYVGVGPKDVIFIFDESVRNPVQAVSAFAAKPEVAKLITLN